MTKERSYLTTGHCAPKYELSCSTCDPFEFYSAKTALDELDGSSQSLGLVSAVTLDLDLGAAGDTSSHEAIGDLPLTSSRG